MSKIRKLSILVLTLVLLSAFPGVAGAAPEAVVRFVLFYSPSCGHCHLVMTEVFPPLLEQYGEQIEILEIDTTTPEGDALYQETVEKFSPRLRGVPTLVIGDTALVGSIDIPEQLPGLIETYLAQGGMDWPALSDLPVEDAITGGENSGTETAETPTESATEAPTPAPTLAPNDGSLNLLLFTTPTCPNCTVVKEQVLPPLQAQYGDRLKILEVNTYEMEGLALYEAAAARYAPPARGVPTLIIGDRILVGAVEIPEELPGLLETYAAQGGVTLPQLPNIEAFIESEVDPVPTPAPEETRDDATWQEKYMRDPVGSTLSVIVLVGLIAALVSVAQPHRWHNQLTERFVPWGFLAIVLVGLIAASYLTYVETTQTEAVCGPVGDCNAVQQSEFVLIFGFLPMAVFGLLGYVAVVGAFSYGYWGSGKWAELAPLATFAFTVFGVAFSAYLTFLEPFVIGATCAWCLTSAVAMGLLLLLSAGRGWAVIRQLQRPKTRAARKRGMQKSYSKSGKEQRA